MKILFYAAIAVVIAITAASAVLLYIKTRPKVESANNPIYETKAVRKRPRVYWYVDIGSYNDTSSIEVAYGKVFILGDQTIFAAFDAKNGDIAWKFEMETPEDADRPGRQPPNPVVYNGMVFAENIYGNIYALDAATGKLKWKYHAETEPKAPPLVDDMHLYFFKDGYLNTLDVNTGKLIDTRFVSISWSTALIYRDNIYVATFVVPEEPDYYYIISTKDLSIIEIIGFGYNRIFVGDLMYYLAYNDSVSIFDIKNNIDKKPVRAEGADVRLGVIYDGTIIMYDEGVRLFAMNIETGREEWTQKLPIYSRPVMADGILYFECKPTTESGNFQYLLTAFDVGKRIKLWEIDIGDRIKSDIIINNGMIYFLTSDGHIYAYE